MKSIRLPSFIRVCILLFVLLLIVGFAIIDRKVRKAPPGLSAKLETEHFNIITNADSGTLNYYKYFFEGFFNHFNTEYLTIGQERPLNVFLFKDTKSYWIWAKIVGGPSTKYGFYMGPKANTIAVNCESGLGTSTHELVHHFIATGFARRPPQWINEGIATFFEKFIGRLNKDGTLTISFGYFSNWRFPITKKFINVLTLDGLIKSEEPNQCVARALMVFLRSKGLFKKFVKEIGIARNDPTGVKTLERIYGATLSRIEEEFREWVKAQPIDANVNLVPRAFVLTESEWQRWWSTNESRLYWNEEEGIFRVKD